MNDTFKSRDDGNSAVQMQLTESQIQFARYLGRLLARRWRMTHVENDAEGALRMSNHKGHLQGDSAAMDY